MEGCCDVAAVEAHDVAGDLLEVALDREVSGVEPDELGVAEVTEVRLTAFGSEEDVAWPQKISVSGCRSRSD